ncbi:N-acetylglucosamine-6-phosphate deacetylase [Clostridium butyricum]|uniref:N-acetylglucosamine-6-phosphate deacetylase n=1 Tax=Clostridium butyricum TaxID=1492 RepID=A0A2S7FBD7_CLOBU|nr:N-acetylglucosamine-6-phosphate deacetylase [Clostridium butyricum]KHD14282.1 N-acetylglucosamine-6-phosphate deacetylase [Clostridium butyricum]MDB2152839.1 N-acetylglucosamine-6-phosphate deacetylase [Clostridium butyricum]PPV14948.1 N-acetylglucosamine-6-phosphate deacetylase [Clostridium butyricum]
MIIKNCKIIYWDRIEEGSLLIEEGKIKEINPKECEDMDVIDAGGLYVSPGFIDVHIHGAGNCDTMDGTVESINTIAETIVKHGTTSFTPTTMTASVSDTRKALKVIQLCKNTGTRGANVLGAHLEGPFINKDAMGAQNGKYILEPCVDKYKEITDGYEDAIVSITISPEVDGAENLVKYVSETGVVCSTGHTKATYEQTIEHIKWGVSHATHFYNAMTPFNHREPGVVGAVFNTDITAELISDGIHVSYPALKVAYKEKGSDKLLLVTDAMRACCMKEGMYTLGGQDVVVKGSSARLKNGVLAGSILTLDKAVKNIYKNLNVPLFEVIKMASYNPAVHCNVQNRKGIIKEGYDADLILFDDDINIKKVFVLGREV